MWAKESTGSRSLDCVTTELSETETHDYFSDCVTTNNDVNVHKAVSHRRTHILNPCAQKVIIR